MEISLSFNNNPFEHLPTRFYITARR